MAEVTTIGSRGSSPLSLLSRSPTPPSLYSHQEPARTPPIPKAKCLVKRSLSPKAEEIRSTETTSSPALDEDNETQSRPSNGKLRTQSVTPADLAENFQSVNGEVDVPAARSSGRRRKTPQHFYDEVEEQRPSPKKIKLQPADGAEQKQRKSVRGVWHPQHLLQNRRSKLAHEGLNVQSLLCNERSWTELSREQQSRLIFMLPNGNRLQLPDTEALPNLPREMLLSNTAAQGHIRLFKEDLENGRYDPSWLADAAEAMEMRANGDFDSWKERNREAFWGQKQKHDFNALAGDSAQHSLDDLVRACCFQVGDVWRLERGMGIGKKDRVLVEKEAQIVGFSEANTLAFKFAKGQQTLLSPDESENIHVDNISGPKMLSDAILREDGRIPKETRGANAWREFRCTRQNQDMGHLWDVREAFHARTADGD